MYTSTQTHSHKISPPTVFYFPKKNNNNYNNNKKQKHETPRTHSQGLSHYTKWCSSKGTTTSTKVTKITIQSIVVEVLVILEVLYFFKRISVSMPRKSPVKIAHLCKNVLAGQPLAVDLYFLSQTILFFNHFQLFFNTTTITLFLLNTNMYRDFHLFQNNALHTDALSRMMFNVLHYSFTETVHAVWYLNQQN